MTPHLHFRDSEDILGGRTRSWVGSTTTEQTRVRPLLFCLGLRLEHFSGGRRGSFFLYAVERTGYADPWPAVLELGVAALNIKMNRRPSQGVPKGGYGALAYPSAK